MSEKEMGIFEEIKTEIDVKEFVKEWALPLTMGGLFAGAVIVPPVVEAISEFWVIGAAVGGYGAYRRWGHLLQRPQQEALESEDHFDEVFTQALSQQPSDVERELAELKRQIEALKQPPTPATPTPETLPDQGVAVLDLIMNCRKPHFLLAGETGAGKTSLVKHIVRERAALGHEIIIADPHNVAGSWGDFRVVAGGEEWDEYQELLVALKDRMVRTYKALDRGEMSENDVKLVTVYFGEWNGAALEFDKRTIGLLEALLARGRKAGIRLVVDCQSTRVESLGFKGKGDLRKNFAGVELELSADGKEHLVYFDGKRVRSAGPFTGWPDPKTPQKALKSELSEESHLRKSLKPDDENVKSRTQSNDENVKSRAQSNDVNLKSSAKVDDDGVKSSAQIEPEKDHILTEPQLQQAIVAYISGDSVYKIAKKLTGKRDGSEFRKVSDEVSAEIRRRMRV